MVEMLDPQEDERVLDPACGTGGFLRETLKHLLERWKQEEAPRVIMTGQKDLLSHQARLARFAQDNLFGADFDLSGACFQYEFVYGGKHDRECLPHGFAGFSARAPPWN